MTHAEEIKLVVSRATGVSVAEMIGPSRIARVVQARHMAQAIIHQNLGHSHPQIGRCFGDRCHSTIHYALNVALPRWRRYIDGFSDMMDRIAKETVVTTGLTVKFKSTRGTQK